MRQNETKWDKMRQSEQSLATRIPALWFSFFLSDPCALTCLQAIRHNKFANSDALCFVLCWWLSFPASLSCCGNNALRVRITWRLHAHLQLFRNGVHSVADVPVVDKTPVRKKTKPGEYIMHTVFTEMEVNNYLSIYQPVNIRRQKMIFTWSKFSWKGDL